MEVICSSQTLVLTTTQKRHIPEDSIFHRYATKTQILQYSLTFVIFNNLDEQQHEHRSPQNYRILWDLARYRPSVFIIPCECSNPLASHCAIWVVSAAPSTERWLNEDLITAQTRVWLLGPPFSPQSGEALSLLVAKCTSASLTPPD
jgi:hypothetical protein